jgi:hypothetical protein
MASWISDAARSQRAEHHLAVVLVQHRRQRQFPAGFGQLVGQDARRHLRAEAVIEGGDLALRVREQLGQRLARHVGDHPVGFGMFEGQLLALVPQENAQRDLGREGVGDGHRPLIASLPVYSVFEGERWRRREEP